MVAVADGSLRMLTALTVAVAVPLLLHSTRVSRSLALVRMTIWLLDDVHAQKVPVGASGEMTTPN